MNAIDKTVQTAEAEVRRLKVTNRKLRKRVKELEQAIHESRELYRDNKPVQMFELWEKVLT